MKRSISHARHGFAFKVAVFDALCRQRFIYDGTGVGAGLQTVVYEYAVDNGFAFPWFIGGDLKFRIVNAACAPTGTIDLSEPA